MHPRSHTLVAMAAGEFGQAHAIGFNHSDTSLSHPLQKLAHAGITAGGLVINFNDGLWRGLQTHTDGVKAE